MRKPRMAQLPANPLMVCIFVGATAIALMASGSPVRAQSTSFELLYSFAGSPGDGSQPVGPLIQAADGNFYGTTSAGGSADDGTIFQMTPDGTVTLLHSFTGGDGDGPGSALLQATDGNFYGTTRGQGAYNAGTVFRMAADGTVTVLYSWPVQYTNSDWWPSALVQASDGNLYGTTPGNIYPPFNRPGTAFRITPDGNYTTLHEFVGGPGDGQTPTASFVVGTDGLLYTTTQYGGGTQGSDDGTIFRITTDGTYALLHNFTGPQAATDGVYPESALVEGIDGSLYGTTSDGGQFGYGSAFRITHEGEFTVLHSFTAAEDIRCRFEGLIRATDGNFYGVGYDKIFQLRRDGSLTILYTFPAGSTPSQLIQASDGNLYGVTRYGGAGDGGNVFAGYGTVFRLTLPQ